MGWKSTILDFAAVLQVVNSKIHTNRIYGWSGFNVDFVLGKIIMRSYFSEVCG